jgi:DnaJ-related protein SCJ1
MFKIKSLYILKMKEKFIIRLFLLIILALNVVCEKDLYKIMEVQRSASQNEIKKKYRELTKLYHPDKNRGDANASDKFAAVAEAYEILSDPKKRRLYDRGGMKAVANEDQGDGGFDPFDVFGMFGGRGQRGRERREDDLKIKLRVSLKDLYLGKEFEVFFIHNMLIVYLHKKYYMSSLQRKWCRLI